eukprot:GCRY01000943.1.p1 GENE.GCRY01000943.1~~GCRY01000943.1.p1  ORF type:complete len:434 (-),score=120.95 GCRY01000943.1:515-1816(-)
MAAKNIPEGFEVLLRKFTTEILRDQPSNIYEYGADYFSKLMMETAKTQKSSSNTESEAPDTEDIWELLKIRFEKADVEKSGVVSKNTVKEVFTTLEPPFSNTYLKHILSECFLSDDGYVAYPTFLDRISEIMETAPQTEVEDLPPQSVVAGLSKEHFLSLLRTPFKDYEVSTDMTKFYRLKKILDNADIGASKKEKTLILFEVKANEDGDVYFDDFAEAVWSTLAYTRVAWSKTLSKSEWQEKLRAVVALPAGQSTASRAAIRDSLQQGDLGLSSRHVLVLLADVAPSSSGLVNFNAFLESAASRLVEWHDVGQIPTRARVQEELPVLRDFHGHDRAEVESRLKAALATVDETGDGLLKQPILLQGLQTVDLDLTPFEINGLLSSVDVNADDRVDVSVLVTGAFEILLFLATQQLLDSKVAQALLPDSARTCD